MELRSFKKMENELVEFLNNHNYDFKIETSPMEDNTYSKKYMCADGAVWFEHNDIVIEEITSELYGILVTSRVKLARCEYWSTDDSKSKYVFRQI